MGAWCWIEEDVEGRLDGCIERFAEEGDGEGVEDMGKGNKREKEGLWG